MVAPWLLVPLVLTACVGESVERQDGRREDRSRRRPPLRRKYEEQSLLRVGSSRHVQFFLPARVAAAFVVLVNSAGTVVRR